jgi:hypothetical protein
MEELAALKAADSVNAEYGPEYVSTGTALTGCIPKGSCSPGVNDIFFKLWLFDVYDPMNTVMQSSLYIPCMKWHYLQNHSH